MITHLRFMFPDLQDGIDGQADYGKDVLTLELPGGPMEFHLGFVRQVLNKPYHVTEPEGGWKREFSDDEKAKLRPIAETLAMLDGNAMFGNTDGKGREWYEMYLPEAHAIYEGNGGDGGWAGEASFAREHTGKTRLTPEEAARVVRDADLSIPDTWGRVVDATMSAGIGANIIAAEVNGAVSTVLRWREGHTAPGPSARQEIRRKLLALLRGTAGQSDRPTTEG